METAQLLGNFGEFVGAIAVVVTLGYLAVQIRQSNLASQTAAINSFFESFSSVNVEPCRDVALIRVIRKGFMTWDGLSRDEQAQMHCYWNDYISKLHMGYRLYRRGVLDEGAYRGWEDFMVASLQTPAVASVWRMMSSIWPADFRNRIESRLADSVSRPPPVTEFLPYWRSD